MSETTRGIQSADAGTAAAEVAPRTGLRPAALWLVAAGSGLAFAALAVAVTQRSGVTIWLDTHVHAWVIDVRSEPANAVARTVTFAGDTAVAIPLIAAVGAAALPGHRSIWQRLGTAGLFVAVAGAGMMLGLLINHALAGQRPPEDAWAGAAGGPTFPSGHTTTATILAFACAWALAAHAPTRRIALAIWWTAGAVALAVGFTRVWLGVHWPTDALGGWLYGTAWSAFAIGAVMIGRRRRARSP